MITDGGACILSMMLSCYHLITTASLQGLGEVLDLWFRGEGGKGAGQDW